MTEDVIAARARALAGALTEAGFARLRIRDGDIEFEVRRTPRPSAAVPAAESSAAAEAAEKPSVRRDDLVTSDVVGIVRLTRPVVVEGSALDGERELGYVETLGIRNPVRARGPGRISAVFVTEGQPVEYGQPLFAIER